MIDNLLKTQWKESGYNYLEENVKNKIIVILDRRFSSAVNHALRISNI